MMSQPSGWSPYSNSSYTPPMKSRGVSKYMFISSMITPFSRSISSSSNFELRSMSTSTSSATSRDSAAHLT
jgi:hypothetical protein